MTDIVNNIRPDNVIPTTSETIERDEPKPIINGKFEDNVEKDVNVLSGDNKVDVEIEPDVKSNDVYIQLCSCSMILNCFSNV